MDWTDIVWMWIQDLGAWVWRQIVYLYQLILQGLEYAWQGLVYVARGVFSLGSHLLRGLRALAHLKPSDIIEALKRAKERYDKFLDWYQRTFVDPFDKLRRQVLDVYRRYFRPLILTIDQFRSIVRVVAIFDRRLAAALDARLYSLERKIMWPITEALRRINEHSSYIRALTTASGYLDRILVLETLRRDALLVWEVLTNPLGRFHTDPPAITHRTLAQMNADFDEYATIGSGPLADQVDRLDRAFEAIRLELGV